VKKFKFNKAKIQNYDITEMKEYAAKRGMELNGQKIVIGIFKGLNNNINKYGEAYCPCRVVSGNKKEDEKNICPCIFQKEEVERDGHCHCFLFKKRIE